MGSSETEMGFPKNGRDTPDIVFVNTEIKSWNTKIGGTKVEMKQYRIEFFSAIFILRGTEEGITQVDRVVAPLVYARICDKG